MPPPVPGRSAGVDEVYYRRRQDELIDKRLEAFEGEMTQLRHDVHTINDRMVRIEARVNAAVILVTTALVIANLVGPIVANFLLR